MPLTQALQIARESNLDLVEVNPNSDPPVCRLLDYGKYRYEQAKRDREARKHQKSALLREIRLRPGTDAHDLENKARIAEKLLGEGDKVKVTVRFRGRELSHPQRGKDVLDRLCDRLKGIASVEQPANMEGRHMTLILAPSKQRKEQAKAAKEVVSG